ncbi:uncharacterized protein FIESC28_07584 [Fusarium coffeatum]|uniref:BHLH domain-containing protein n=1 Tax=Fusarium coffeatum TaxID=231269 RepID=A0A366RDT5_9HYPO|nr:uncharacterized protein FIESC28_07584 [Fusarium coffeatum]RBR14738.1 hypothetical protein FIESC28_07584 [Fusarium coffeatum]
MIAPAPPGHFPPQQPISSPNRTSREPPPRPETTEIETHHHANHPTALPVLGLQLPVSGTVPESSRAQSRAHLNLDLDLNLHTPSHASRLSREHEHEHEHGVGHGHGHGHEIHRPGAHSAQSSAGLPPTGFASHLPPASSGPMSLDWNMYHVPPNLQLNANQFDFEVPGHINVVGHPNHLAHGPTNPNPFNYGHSIVSPSSIHPNSAHFNAATSTQWDDSLGHDASTPKVRTPSHHVSSNPWAEINEPAGDNNLTPVSRSRKSARTRRQKKEPRKLSDASQGGRSNSTGGTAPSVSDAASPSSASQHSRASIGSKSASMTSAASTASSRQSKLRSASRTSKNSRDKPNDTPEDRRTRASHNLVEKQYRNRLNAQFESLLSALPDQIRHGDNGGGNGNEDNESDQGNDPDRRVSKGEVLEMARKHIQALERERDQLELENFELHGNLRKLKGSGSESGSCPSGQESSIESGIIKKEMEAGDHDRSES